jgi:CLIP-associating protein 1/2
LKVDKFSAGLSHSISTDSLAASAAAAAEDENIEPLDVDSNRDIDDMLRNMSYHFEGRESEQNWIPREKSVETLRKLVRGNAPHSFPQHFFAGIKNILDGILKVANSLRTTLSTAGCLLIQDLARICGPGIDPMVEMLLQNMIKLCAGMKKISAQNANATVDIIIQNVSYVPRILQHIWFACQDKNTQPRQYATGWLKTLLNKQARHKSSIEHGGGLDVVEKCIKRGLADANPGVRESMRGTYWTFNQLWPDQADEYVDPLGLRVEEANMRCRIMSTLDTKSKSLLEKDPNNPNGTNSSDGRSRPALSNSVSAASHRLTLKETIAAQKRAAAAKSATKSAPPRPESAQSTYAEAKPTRPPSRAQASKPTGSMRTVPTGTHLSSLSSAPMRPGAKTRRPEIPRPATADPYSDRRPPSAASHNKTFSPDVSPVRTRAKTPTVKSPGRPKSRAGGAPVSTARGKPKRLDIASLKSNDPRAIAGPKSDPEDIAQAPLIVDEPFVPHSHEGTQAVEDTIVDTSDFVPEPIPATATETLAAPVESESFINAASQEDTPSRMQISHSRETSLESRGVSSVIASPNARHSRHSSEDQNSKIPSPVTPRTVNHTEARLVGLRVYEDPDAQKSVDETISQNEEPVLTDHHHPVLEEIQVNEPNTPAPRDDIQTTLSPSAHVDNALPPDGSENGHRAWGKAGAGERRRSISPRSKDLTKAKDMIDKGISRIRAKALDVHGYRKLQGLIKYHGALFTDQSKYNEMLVALLDALETASDEKRSSASRSMDLKAQILVTIRLMFAHNETYFAAYYPRVMTSLLNTRKQYELTTNHIVSGLEETAEDIVSSCQPQEVMTAVLDLVEAEQNDDEGYRAITMGIYVLSGLLRRLNKYQKKLGDAEISRLGQFGNVSLSQPQPDVRRAVTEFCVELHEMMHDEEAFWRMINSTGNDHRNLLTYFIAKKSSEGAVRA